MSDREKLLRERMRRRSIIQTGAGMYYLPRPEATVEMVSDDWLQSGLNIRIPRAVLEMIVSETAKSVLKSDIKQTTKMMIINMIMMPVALCTSFISLVTAIIFLGMGAWVTSIPFILTSIFGIYFYFLNKNRKG